MSSRNRRQRRDARARPYPSPAARQGEMLKTELNELQLLQRTQMRFGMPNTLDVDFPLFKQKKYSFVVNAFAFTIQASSTAVYAASYVTTLSGFPQASAFTNLFDRYRILNVNLQFNPQVGDPTGGGAVLTAIDYDDGNVPTAEIAQRDTAMATPVGIYFERSYVPRIATAAYGGALFTSFANTSSRTWIDTASTNVQYYGMKIYLPLQTQNVTAYSVTARIFVQFKNNF